MRYKRVDHLMIRRTRKLVGDQVNKRPAASSHEDGHRKNLSALSHGMERRWLIINSPDTKSLRLRSHRSNKSPSLQCNPIPIWHVATSEYRSFKNKKMVRVCNSDHEPVIWPSSPCRHASPGRKIQVPGHKPVQPKITIMFTRVIAHMGLFSSGSS